MWIHYAVECRPRGSYIGRRFDRDDRRSGWGKGGKMSGEHAEDRAGRITGYDSEMVASVRSQAADVGIDTPIRTPSQCLGSGRESEVGSGAVFEVHSRGQPMRIDAAMEPG